MSYTDLLFNRKQIVIVFGYDHKRVIVIQSEKNPLSWFLVKRKVAKKKGIRYCKLKKACGEVDIGKLFALLRSNAWV